MIRALLLLSVLLAVGVSAWDHFEFDITLFCNIQDRASYNIKIEWYDHDTISSYDQICMPRTMKVKTGKYSFSMSGALNGDEYKSDGYKPIAYISHDCTNDKKKADLILTITTLCEMGSGCHYRIVKDITNLQGSVSEAPEDFKKEMTPFPDFP